MATGYLQEAPQRDLNYSDLYDAAQSAQDRLRRKVNPLFLSPRDWRRKAADKGSVVNKISGSPKIFVMGSEKDLGSGKDLRADFSAHL